MKGKTGTFSNWENMNAKLCSFIVVNEKKNYMKMSSSFLQENFNDTQSWSSSEFQRVPQHGPLASVLGVKGTVITGAETPHWGWKILDVTGSLTWIPLGAGFSNGKRNCSFLGGFEVFHWTFFPSSLNTLQHNPNCRWISGLSVGLESHTVLSLLL